MKNTMQLKAIIKNIAMEKSISAQLVMQNFTLGRFVNRFGKREEVKSRDLKE